MAVNSELIETIKASQLPKLANPTTGDFIHAQGDDLSTTPISYFIEKINNGYNGTLTPSTVVPNTGYYRYKVVDPGTYANVSPNITVTQDEINKNFVVIAIRDGVAMKELDPKPQNDTSDLVTKAEFTPIKEKVNGLESDISLVLNFNQNSFYQDLTSNPNFPNAGAIVDVEGMDGLPVDITSNAFDQLWCGFRDATGKAIIAFHTPNGSDLGTYSTNIPDGSKELCVSRWGNVASKVVVHKRSYASFPTEKAAKDALNTANGNKAALAMLEKYTGYELVYPVMTPGGYYNNQLVLQGFNERAQYAEIDVTGLEGVSLDLMIWSFEAVCCGFINAQGNVLNVFQTGKPTEPVNITIPKGATKMRLSNYENGADRLTPYYILKRGERTSIEPYIKGFKYSTLGSFFEKLGIGKSTPINLVFSGNSITNFQYTNNSTNYPVDSLTRPRALYNKETFTYRTWQWLNPGSYNDYTGKLVSDHGNMKFVKGDNSSVTKTGTWYSNFENGNYNDLGTYFSSGGADIQEFFHSKTAGDTMSIIAPTGALGVSIVGFRFTQPKSYGGFTSGASTMKVYIGGVLKDTVSLVGEELVYFDYKFDAPLTENTVIKIENAENKWLPIWGFEVWSGKCIRPIKLAWSGAGLGAAQSRINNFLNNNTIDMVIHEAHLINEKFVQVEALMSEYNNYCKEMKSKNIPLVFLITHRQNTVEPALNERAIALINILKANNVPYINVWGCFDDKFKGGRIPDSYYIDGTHLADPGHDVYFELIQSALKKKY
ncbi:hypothetical protein CMT52_09875 [Elizabethkingia anophelis]|nr:hypothetical protein [Elizabethkingia anophelis]